MSKQTQNVAVLLLAAVFVTQSAMASVKLPDAGSSSLLLAMAVGGLVFVRGFFRK